MNSIYSPKQVEKGEEAEGRGILKTDRSLWGKERQSRSFDRRREEGGIVRSPQAREKGGGKASRGFKEKIERRHLLGASSALSTGFSYHQGGGGGMEPRWKGKRGKLQLASQSGKVCEGRASRRAGGNPKY